MASLTGQAILINLTINQYLSRCKSIVPSAFIDVLAMFTSSARSDQHFVLSPWLLVYNRRVLKKKLVIIFSRGRIQSLFIFGLGLLLDSLTEIDNIRSIFFADWVLASSRRVLPVKFFHIRDYILTDGWIIKEVELRQLRSLCSQPRLKKEAL